MINLAGWHDVLIAASAAAATLAGLILTAMAVNIDSIIKLPYLPSRAGSAIGSLIYVLVVTVAALIPNATSLGVGVVAMAVLVGPIAIHTDVVVRQLQIRPRQGFSRLWSKVVLSVGQIAPFIVGGVLLVSGGSGSGSGVLGLDWLMIGAMAVFVGSVVNAWVLLVEIRR